MLIIKLKDQLGNQMFSYASVKCICIEKGLQFGYYRVPLDDRYVNDVDAKYGKDLSTIFSLPTEEFVSSVPAEYEVYFEPTVEKRNHPDYAKRVLSEITDNSVMDGHFIVNHFIKNHLSEMREWFAFPVDVRRKMNEKLSELRENNVSRPIVSVHFRVGKDYVERGFKLKDSYWINAASHAKKKLDNPLFVCLFDKKTKAVKKFIEKYDAVECHGSLIEDLCMISLCDANIVCNSTFSVMGAYLNPDSKLTISPGTYPVGVKYKVDAIFLDEWAKIGNGEIDTVSYMLGQLRDVASRAKKMFVK